MKPARGIYESLRSIWTGRPPVNRERERGPKSAKGPSALSLIAIKVQAEEEEKKKKYSKCAPQRVSLNTCGKYVRAVLLRGVGHTLTLTHTIRREEERKRYRYANITRARGPSLSRERVVVYT